MTGPDFKPYSRQFAANPYPTYARLRDKHPIFYSEEYGLTFFSRYRDIAALLEDARLGRTMDHVLTREEFAERRRAEGWERLPNYNRYVRVNLLETEGSHHDRLRRLLKKAFNAVRIRKLRSRIQELTDELIQDLLPRGRMEFLKDLAVPLPVFMISELLGWPLDERHRLRPWSAAIVKLYEKDHTEADKLEAEAATTEFAAMLRDLTDLRRAEPTDDLISTLAHVELEGERLSNDELIASCMLFLNAGHEATVNAAGNGTLALLSHPDQRAKLVNDPSLIGSALDEMFRFDPPLHFFHRYVLKDMEYEGRDFRRGDTVGFLYGAANRDPEAFPDPDRFDITRNPNRHLAFGRGVHFCMGAPLARLELEILFTTLLERIPDIQLDEPEPEFSAGLVFRGLKKLRLSW